MCVYVCVCVCVCVPGVRARVRSARSARSARATRVLVCIQTHVTRACTRGGSAWSRAPRGCASHFSWIKCAAKRLDKISRNFTRCRCAGSVRFLRRAAVDKRLILYPTPYTLHPTSNTPHPTPHTLHPTPYTTPHTLRRTPCFLSRDGRCSPHGHACPSSSRPTSSRPTSSGSANLGARRVTPAHRSL